MWSPKFIFCELSSYIGPKIWKKIVINNRVFKKVCPKEGSEKKAITIGYFFKNFTYCTILFLALFLTWKNALCAVRRQKSTLSRNLRRYFCRYLCTPKTCEISMYFFYSTMFENNVLCIQNTNTYSWRVWQTKHNLLLTQIQKKNYVRQVV